jgi:hypothetical protein
VTLVRACRLASARLQDLGDVVALPNTRIAQRSGRLSGMLRLKDQAAAGREAPVGRER